MWLDKLSKEETATYQKRVEECHKEIEYLTKKLDKDTQSSIGSSDSNNVTDANGLACKEILYPREVDLACEEILFPREVDIEDACSTTSRL